MKFSLRTENILPYYTIKTYEVDFNVYRGKIQQNENESCFKLETLW